MKSKPKYSKVVLKFSGEMLGGDQGSGLDPFSFAFFAKEIASAVRNFDVRMAVVIGGGNIIRGAHTKLPIDRVTGDYLGMLATVINGVALRSALESEGVRARVLSAVEALGTVPYTVESAKEYWDAGDVLVLVGGTGSPFFTTDTTAALRAAELEAEVLLKGTKVDGIYTSDPKKFADAEFLPELSYEDALVHNLKVMDMTAFALCMEQKIPILVFNASVQGNLVRILAGEKIGSLVH